MRHTLFIFAQLHTVAQPLVLRKRRLHLEAPSFARRHRVQIDHRLGVLILKLVAFKGVRVGLATLEMCIKVQQRLQITQSELLVVRCRPRLLRLSALRVTARKVFMWPKQVVR